MKLHIRMCALFRRQSDLLPIAATNTAGGVCLGWGSDPLCLGTVLGCKLICGMKRRA